MDTFSAESTKPLLLVSLVALPTPSLLRLVCLSVAFSPSHIGSFSSYPSWGPGLILEDWELRCGQCLWIEHWEGVNRTKEIWAISPLLKLPKQALSPACGSQHR